MNIITNGFVYFVSVQGTQNILNNNTITYTV